MYKLRLSIVFLVVFVSACAPEFINVDSDGNMLPDGVKKFKDGRVTCWIFENKTMSCLKDSDINK